MTIEEKAKRYDETLERAKSFELPEYKNIMVSVFPELAESEDERIRKDIIEMLRNWASEHYITKKQFSERMTWLEKQGEEKTVNYPIEGMFPYTDPADTLDGEIENIWNKLRNCDNTFTAAKSGFYEVIHHFANWLEKQGEQKPTDKIESKFHEDEWVSNGDYTWKIIEVTSLDYILQSQDGNIVDDTISHVDEQFHSFSIEDAKDGDVLASELCDSIILFRGIKDDNIDFYCDYDFSKIDIPGDRFTVNNGQHYGNVEDSKDFYPATKEQRDILFSKMHEAGYEWNAEKKELKKISQRMISAEAKEALYDKPTDEEMKELLRTEYEKGRADAIAEMKKDYSEDDERIRQCLIRDQEEALDDVRNDKYGHSEIISDLKEMYHERIDWLKQLKQRIGG